MVNIDPILYIGISQSFFAGLLISTKKPSTIKYSRSGLKDAKAQDYLEGADQHPGEPVERKANKS